VFLDECHDKPVPTWSLGRVQAEPADMLVAGSELLRERRPNAFDHGTRVVVCDPATGFGGAETRIASPWFATEQELS
jgi:hypothetical protein